MADPSDNERLTELELEVMRLSRYVEELNQVVISGSLQIEALKLKVERLEGALKSLELDAPANEKPPHY